MRVASWQIPFLLTTTLICGAGQFAKTCVAADNLVTFEKVAEYLDLEVKEERILKILADSSMQFVLDARQIEILKSKGASEKLLEAMQQKGQSAGRNAASVGSDISDFVLILDCSGSMKDMTPDGKMKWDVAKQAAMDLVAAVPDGRQLAFVVYGHNKEQACSAAEVLRPIAPLSSKSRNALLARIDQLKPIGHTPISLALQLAGQELEGSSGLSKIMLITDGMETCQGNPADTAKSLTANANLKGGVNVIGFGLKEAEMLAVSQIAKAGNGEYYDAKNAADLVRTVKVVEQSLTRSGSKLNAAKSDVKPSKDAANPAMIELGKYVSARLATGKAHYLAIELPAGEYVAILDFKRADDSNSNLIFRVQLDGQRLIGTNEVDRVCRGAATFKSDGGKHLISLENDASGNIAAYHFGIYPAGETVPQPYLEYASYEFQTVPVGKSIDINLDPKGLDTRSEFVRIKLDEGDYMLSYVMRSPKAKGNYGAYIQDVNELGVVHERMGYAFSSEKSLSVRQKILVADEQELLLRITCYDNAPIQGTFSVTRLSDSDAK